MLNKMQILVDKITFMNIQNWLNDLFQNLYFSNELYIENKDNYYDTQRLHSCFLLYILISHLINLHFYIAGRNNNNENGFNSKQHIIILFNPFRLPKWVEIFICEDELWSNNQGIDALCAFDTRTMALPCGCCIVLAQNCQSDHHKARARMILLNTINNRYNI